jgi:hypothetical protein
VGGALLLTDAHQAAGSGAVPIDAGLFNAQLGGGTLTPGLLSGLAEVFQYTDAAYLQVTVKTETLCPRVRVLASGYALNADHLDGLDSSEVLDTSDSLQKKSGSLQVLGGVDYGMGADDDLVASDVETLTSGAVADSLHTHAAVGADTLDGLDSTAFLRSDASDSYSGGTLTVGKSSTLSVAGLLTANGAIYMDQGGPDGNQSLYFHEGGLPDGESLAWNDVDSRFEFSDDIRTLATVTASRLVDSGDSGYYVDPASRSDLNQLFLHDPSLYLNSDGPDSTASVYFFDGGSNKGKFIRWNDTESRFQIGGDTTVLGGLEIDGGISDDQIAFNGIELLSWDDSQARFELTDDLAVINTIGVGSATVESAGYSWFGNSGPPVSGDMSTDGDIYVQYDIETGGNIYVGETLIVGDPVPTANQAFSSFGNAEMRSEPQVNSVEDVFIEGDLEVGGYLYTTSRIGLQVYDIAEASNFNTIDDNDVSTVEAFYWYHDGSYAPTAKLAELQEDGDFRIRGVLSQNVSFDIAESFLAAEPLEAGELVRVDPGNPVAVLRTTGPTDRAVIGVVSSSPGVLLGSAPFDTESLRQTWGDEQHDRFLAQKERLQQELLAAHPSLQSSLASPGFLDDGAAEASGRPPGQAGTELESDLLGLALERFFEQNFVAVALAGRVPVKVDASFGAIEPGDPLAPSPLPGVAMRATGEGPVIGMSLEALAVGSGMVLAMVGRGDLAVGEAVASIQEQQDEIVEELEERTVDPETGVHSLPGHLQVVLDSDDDDQARFSVFRDGENGLGDEVFRVDEDGNVFTKGAVSPASMDVAEFFPVLESVQAGHVLVASRKREGACELSREAADRAVLGVVAASPGVTLGRSIERIASADAEIAEQLELARRVGDLEAEDRLWADLERRFLASYAPVALTGTVDVLVDAGYGAIRVGDLLTSSPTPGHAMRAAEALPGTILGKAIGSLETGTGTVRMLVMAR